MKTRLLDLAKGIRDDKQSLLIVVLIAVLSASFYVFLNIADEVSEGELDAFDRLLFLSVRDDANPQLLLGPPWLEESAVEITALGGIPVIVLLTLLVCGGLLAARLPGPSLFVLLAISGGALLSTGLKAFYERPRPDLVDHLDVIHTASFPSGHATISTLTYLTLGALLAKVVPRRSFRIYILSCALLLAVMIGLSRIYLGVHWPTDVAAGWALGSGWAALSFLVLTGIRWLRRREAGLERDDDGGRSPAEDR